MSRRIFIACTVVVISCVAAVAMVMVRQGGAQPLVVTAQFEDTIGLYEGNAVSVLGIQVGKVTRIVPKPTYVEVTLELDTGVDIPADVQAVTVSTSILTDRHIELTPPYQGGPKLRSGDLLRLGRTRTPVEFDRTLAMVDKLSSALKGDGHGGGPIADLIAIGDKMTSGNGADIKSTLDQLSKALQLGSDGGAQSSKNIQTIARNLADLTAAASNNDTAIREFGSDVRQLSDIVADEHLGTGTTGRQLNEILTRAADLLEKNREGLKSTATDFTTVTRAVVDYRRELAEFFDVAPLAINNVYNTIDSDTGTIRVHALADKLLFDSQFGKEVCNLIGKKQLGCATSTLRDYGPDFGVTGMLELMAGVQR
ncbi:MCE family protein [Mycobacterium sp. SM3041]|uniref:MCE family protein n=1 Tax=Mycobacterium sp. SM3041 TaxID=3114291 RepID=UPI0032048267